MNESQIVGLVLLILGGLQVVRPDLMIRFQVWSQRVIMGAKYEPSDRTYKVVRIIGVLILLLGFLAVTGAIE